MSTVVQCAESVPAEGVILFDFDARMLHPGDECGRYLAAANPVEHDVSAHLCSCALNQDSGKLLAHRA